MKMKIQKIIYLTIKSNSWQLRRNKFILITSFTKINTEPDAQFTYEWTEFDRNIYEVKLDDLFTTITEELQRNYYNIFQLSNKEENIAANFAGIFILAMKNILHMKCEIKTGSSGTLLILIHDLMFHAGEYINPILIIEFHTENKSSCESSNLREYYLTDFPGSIAHSAYLKCINVEDWKMASRWLKIDDPFLSFILTNYHNIIYESRVQVRLSILTFNSY